MCFIGLYGTCLVAEGQATNLPEESDNARAEAFRRLYQVRPLPAGRRPDQRGRHHAVRALRPDPGPQSTPCPRRAGRWSPPSPSR
ncbi:MAG: hypothetical protein MZU91_01560 [Desulfosudis oleivorans]|nr:hypothetical protein [Desulfosudis oleivorans]